MIPIKNNFCQSYLEEAILEWLADLGYEIIFAPVGGSPLGGSPLGGSPLGGSPLGWLSLTYQL